MFKRSRADQWALYATAAIFLLGMAALVTRWDFGQPQSESLVTTKHTVVTKTVNGKPQTTSTTETDTTGRDDSIWERAMGNTGFGVLRILLVVLVAFLGGTAVQRVMLGQFGLKIGPLEVPQITPDDVNAKVTDIITGSGWQARGEKASEDEQRAPHADENRIMNTVQDDDNIALVALGLDVETELNQLDDAYGDEVDQAQPETGERNH